MAISAKITSQKRWTINVGIANGGTKDHSKLLNRDAEGQHSMSAIVGLNEAIKALNNHTAAKGNPHGATAEQVGARPDNWLPSLEDIGAAPSGYGLGKTQLIDVEDIDNTTAPGWYHIASNMTIATVSANYWHMEVSAYADGSSHCVQKIYPIQPTLGHIEIVRRKYSGTWEEWEHTNPPMVLGVEYRTTERHKGKAVYAAKILVGTLGNAGTVSATLPHTPTETVEIRGFAYTGNLVETFPMVSVTDGTVLALMRKAGGQTLAVKSFTDMSNYTAVVYVKYTRE